MSGDRKLDVNRLLRPRSIAVVGASADPATLGGGVLRNIQTSGFKGDLHLVSTSRKEIAGIATLPSIRDLPMGVDAVVLNVPKAVVGQALADCVARGVGGAVVFAAGFGEAGPEGRNEQDAIAAACREGGLALLGPNCLGLVNYAANTALTFEALSFTPFEAKRHVGVVAQSGAIASTMRAALQARGLAVSHVVATGNEAVLRADHFIDAFIDAGTGVVVAYVEQIRDPAAFLIVAAKARKAGVPIVLVHPGASERGAAAAASHTGAMAGEYKVMQTIVRAEGVVMVDTMDELIDATVILNRFPKPSEKGVAIVTNSGAIKGLSLDFCETVGMPVAPLSETDRAALAAMLPPHSEIDNPFDVGTSGYGDASVFAKSSEVMLENPEAGPVLLALTGGGPWQQKAKGEAVAPVAAKAKKPVVLAITGDEAPLDPGCIAAMRENQSPLFRSPERALRALSAIRRQAIALRDLADAAPAPKKLPKPPGGGVLPEYRGKDYLRALGVAVPEGALAQTLEGGEAIAARIGYPIAIKAQGETLAHKSEYGGVIIGVKGKDHLRTEWARLLNNVSGHKLDGVLVEKMGESGVELVIGGRNDPQWGPIVVFGLGGVIVEALDAIEMLPAHANKNQIKERLLAMRGAKLLGPFRRRPARDIDAICDVIMRVGAVLRAEPTLREVDINPLVALAEGQGALALDALFVFD